MQQHLVHVPLPSVQKRVALAGSGVRFIRCWRVGELFDYHLCVDAGVHGTSCRHFGVTGICRGYLFRVEILLSDYCPVKSLKYIIFKKCSLFSIHHLTMSSPGRASRTSIFGTCRYISIGDQHRHSRHTWHLSKGGGIVPYFLSFFSRLSIKVISFKYAEYIVCEFNDPFFFCTPVEWEGRC